MCKNEFLSLHGTLYFTLDVSKILKGKPSSTEESHLFLESDSNNRAIEASVLNQVQMCLVSSKNFHAIRTLS